MSRLKCTILDDYQQVALQYGDWQRISDKVEVRSISEYLADSDNLIAEIQDSDILVIMRERTPMPAERLAQLPNLKLLITSGMRNSSIDLEACQKQGIVVCGTKSLKNPPAELTWALLLGLARHIVPENNAFRQNGPWQSTVGISLAGKRLGLLGLGAIGEKVARVAKAFDMKVSAWSQNLTQERADEVGVELAESKEALLSGADFVSIHLVPGQRNRNLVSAAEFKVMKSSAFLINTSRSAIVDQQAMIEALEQGDIAGAGIDVFDQEPLPADSKLRQLPNVLAMPHLGYVADTNYQHYFSEAVEDIEAFLQGSPTRTLV